MAFYENFISLCNSIHKSPTAAILEIGLERSSGTRWKKGGMPSDATARRIADYFGVTVDDLLGNKNSPAEDGEADMVATTPAERELLRLLRSFPEEDQARILAAIETLLRTQGLQK